MNQEPQIQKSVLLPVIIAIIITALVIGGGVYFFLQKRSVPPSETVSTTEEKTIPTPPTEKPATILPKDYIVTEGATLVQGVRKQTHFSVYKTDGTLVKKIDLPTDAARSAAGSNGVYGNKIYYLSGSEETTSIAEIDPLTGEHRVFSFTETKSTNPGNVLFAIIAWAVSQDNKTVAWVDTKGTLHVANRDGSTQKNFPMKGGNSVGRAWVEFSKNSSSLYVWRQGPSSLEKLDLSKETIIPIVTSENGDFLISPSGRHIVYSNFNTPLAIRNLISGQDIPITLPETYDGWYFHSFSPDESKLYFSAFLIHDKTDYYSVRMDGTNLSKTEDARLQNDLAFLSESFAITRCGEGTCLVELASTKQPATISNEWFLGSFK